MKHFILASLALLCVQTVQAADDREADGSSVTCTGATTAVVTRRNGQGNELEALEKISATVRGNETVATTEVRLKSKYGSSTTRPFFVEVTRVFVDGHVEKLIRVSTVLGGHEVSVESERTSDGQVSMKIDKLDVNCRVD